MPGELGIWIFVLGDMTIFGALFTVFLDARLGQEAAFAASRGELTQAFGMVNMIVLLTSSLFVVLAVGAFREGRRQIAERLFTAAAACAVIFLALKAVEYGEKFSAGIDPGTNDFFMYFFILTGVHAAHVVLGLVVLTYLRHITRRPDPGPHAVRNLESGASFWHMVDLLWVVLFPLLYLAS